MNKDEEFAAKLFETFKIEAADHIQHLTNNLVVLEQTGANQISQEMLDTIFREAHSLKGAARSVNFLSVQTICQSIENVLASLKKGAIHVSKELFDTLYKALDLVNNLIFFPTGQHEETNDGIASIQDKLDQLIKSEPIDATKTEVPQKTQAIEPVSVKIAKPDEIKTSEPPKIALPEDTIHDQTIRVSLQKLDRLLQNVEELLILKLASKQQATNLKQIQTALYDVLKKHSRTQPELSLIRSQVMQDDGNLKKREAISKFLNAYENQQFFLRKLQDEINKAFRASSQNHRVVSSMIDSFLEDTKKLLMQPFYTLTESFPRMIRDISKELGKEVQFEVIGGDIEVDKRILEEMKDPLIHLIRNSIDHGIEKADVRLAKNKSAKGLIRISVSQIGGNSIEIRMRDDGAGINLDSIKKISVKKGIVTAQDVASMDKKELLSLIFKSGFSTSPIITELSGRGLGLVIVSEKVEKLEGQLFVESSESGTEFRIVLPMTLATFRGIYIKVADREFILPTYNVKRLIRVDQQAIKFLENQRSFVLDGEVIPYVDLKDILKIEGATDKKNKAKVMILKSMKTKVGFGIDEVSKEQEVLVKGLGKQLIRVKHVLAATVTEAGQVIPILNPKDLIRSAFNSQHQGSKKGETVEAQKFVLLVEDSITTRMLLKNILEGAGFKVKTAVDGLEGLGFLKSEKFDLLLTDIEMPRMDGLTLTQKVREMEQYRELPIILCTSRGSKEDREKGVSAGADAYIDKASFTQNQLIDLIQKLL